MNDQRNTIPTSDFLAWRNDAAYPEPTPEDQRSPEFEAVWGAIKGWDICRGGNGMGLYSGASGSEVMHILLALRSLPGWTSPTEGVGTREWAWSRAKKEDEDTIAALRADLEEERARRDLAEAQLGGVHSILGKYHDPNNEMMGSLTALQQISTMLATSLDAELSDDECKALCKKLGIDVPAWAQEIRQRVASRSEIWLAEKATEEHSARQAAEATLDAVRYEVQLWEQYAEEPEDSHKSMQRLQRLVVQKAKVEPKPEADGEPPTLGAEVFELRTKLDAVTGALDKLIASIEATHGDGDEEEPDGVLDADLIHEDLKGIRALAR